MKIIKWFALVTTSVVLFSNVVKGFTIDGTASPGEYPAGQPLAVQTLGSNASSTPSTNGDVALASISALDAAYGVISNGTLYLLIAGNMESAFGSSNKYDKLSIFINTGASGQNTLSNNNFDVDTPSAIRRMSSGGDPINCAGCPGLTFDTGFNASYWIGISYGGGPTPTLYVNYATLPGGGGGGGSYVGSVQPGATNTVPNNDNPFGIEAAMNNSNIGGVDTNSCNVNTNGVAQSIAAAAVTTGVELAIPLNALGGPAIVGPVQVCAFISTNDYTSIYDQILGPVTTNGCVDAFAFGDPLTNNFSTLPGTHYFTVPFAGCNYTISPFNAFYGNTGGSGTLSVGANGSGSCGWTAVSSAPWLVITGGASGSGPSTETISYTVSNNTSTLTREATITVTGTANGVDVFTVSEGGVALAKDFTVDGTADPAYGCALAVQNIGTGFGNSTNGDPVVAAGGSELDAAYGMIENNVLFLVLAGNLENNGNKIMVFFMTGPGGQNTLTNVNPSGVGSYNNTANSSLNNMGVQTNKPTFFPGLTFDPSFAPNYWMDMNCSGGTNSFLFFADYAQLWPGGTNSSGIATNGYYLGGNTGTNGVLYKVNSGVPFNPFGIQATINNSNTNGVDGGPGGGNGCYTNAITGDLESVDAATVTNGVELGIPLAALGSPTGAIAVCAFITGGDGTYMSNQILGPPGTNASFCQVNLGAVTNTAAVNLGTLPGQHYFLVGPETRITSITIPSGTTNVAVSFKTEANSNLLYQLQRTGALSNGTTWTSFGPFGIPTNNAGGIMTLTDTKGATNKPARFYRVQQLNNCTP